MNLVQIRTAVRDILTAGKGTDTIIKNDPFWSDVIVNYFINDGYKAIFKALRRSNSDYFTRTMRTTDAALNIFGRSFTPSTLKITNNVGSYTLPPDFLKMKVITDLRTDNKSRFRFGDLVREEFRIIYNDTAQATVGSFLCDILGLRTLVIRPIPDVDFDVEYIYERQLPKLEDYGTGTITINNDSDTATFAGADLTNRFSVGDEVVPNVSLASPEATDPSAQYLVVKTITPATNSVVFENKYFGTNLSAASYIKTMVPEFPDLYHDLLIQFAVHSGLLKGTNPNLKAATLWQNKFNVQLADMIGDAEVRQGSDPELTEAYLEDDY